MNHLHNHLIQVLHFTKSHTKVRELKAFAQHHSEMVSRLDLEYWSPDSCQYTSHCSGLPRLKVSIHLKCRCFGYWQIQINTVLMASANTPWPFQCA